MDSHRRLRILYLHQHYSRPTGSTATRSFLQARALAEAALAVEGGRYAEARNLAARDDEIGDLTKVFSRMAESVARHERDIRRIAYTDPLTGLGNRLALNLPSINVTVQQMLDALENVAGTKVRQRVRFERDERIAGIVSNWARGASSERANALGLKPDASFEAIIEQYIEDCRTQSSYPAGALQGL